MPFWKKSDDSHTIEDDNRHEANRERQVRNRFWNLSTSVVLVLLVMVVPLALWALKSAGAYQPELTIGIVILAGALLLVTCMTFLMRTAWALGLENRQGELGLPPGSIRAILALLLVLMFVILSVFLYWQTRTTSTVVRDNVRADELAQLPAGRFVVLGSQGAGDELRFRVEMTMDVASKESTDIAKQIVTMLGTLVVSVASFYFGANSVQAGARLIQDPPAKSPSTLGQGPGSPAAPNKDAASKEGSPDQTAAVPA